MVKIMNYFIISRKRATGIDYWCASNIQRGTFDGTDVTVFTCSGRVEVIPTSEVVCITPSTPLPTQLQVFAK